MLNKLKSLILFILIFTISILSYNSQRVYALDGRTYVTIAEAAAITAETAVATGATVAITPIVVGTLVAGALLYGGYKVVSTYGSEIQSYIKSKADKLSFKETNDYLYTKDGKVGLTPSGYAWANDIGSTLKKDSSFSTNYNTSNTVGNGSPYQFGKFYMRPYSVFSVDKKNYIFVKVSAYDTINICIKGRSDKVSYVKTLTPTKDTYYRVRSYSMSGTAEIHSSEDNKDYYRVTSIIKSTGGYSERAYFTDDSTVYIGYYTQSGTVYAPDGVVTSVPPTPMEVGQTVALPSTSTQIEGMTVFDTSLQPGSITANDFALDTAPNTDTDIDTAPEGGGNTAPNLDLDVPSKDIPKLDFSPLMVATQKFPFCIPWDLWASYKVFEGNSVPFMYEFKEVQLNGTVTGGQSITVLPNFKIDFAKYPSVDTAIQMFKYLQLLLFIVMLVLRTRNLIRG